MSNISQSAEDSSNPNVTLNENDKVDWVRIWCVGILTLIGWAAIALLLYAEKPSIDSTKLPDTFFQGLSPSIKACYAYHTTYSPMIIAFAMGIALGISYIFGTFLYKKFRETSSNERRHFWKGIENRISHEKFFEIREIVSEFREYEKIILDRRNVYWSLFTRVTLAILVVGLIGLLISACKIESQAGLPIISGIIAFIIGQGSELLHSASGPILYVQANQSRRSQHESEQPEQSTERST